MVARHAYMRSRLCNNCFFALLNIFSKSFSAQASVRHRLAAINPKIYHPRRSFTNYRPLNLDLAQQPHQQDVVLEEKTDLDIVQSQNQDEAEISESTIPWYLQVKTPQRESSLPTDRQQVPELPPDPPPLLKPILEHISIDIGLDDLMIFDLRKIDPPPALGANLIMILGTARSEKHLHVSAERFCRWLKVTHKLSAYADGLLGRGELKLKLRRKARRAKLLSNVGSSETANADDGIRTGWICVNIGTIRNVERDDISSPEQEGYVGFGSEEEGSKVVIQMLTQEKREELDLETLWGQALMRQQRKEARIAKGEGEPRISQEIGPGS